jgi:ADP-ribosylglycohydrolase
MGDALGYPIEFEASGPAIAARYGVTAPLGLRFAGQDGGLVSDDTQMSLFTAEGLIRARRAAAGDPTPHLLAAYQRWYTTQEMRRGEPARPRRGQGLLLGEARLYARRAPGNTCLGAIAQSFMGRPTPTVALPPNYSKGCGAVMRSAPIGLAAASATQAFRRARDAAVLTHGHPSGYLSAAYFASVIFDVARDMPFEQAMARAEVELEREEGCDEMVAILAEAKRLVADGPPARDAIERLGGGWTGEEALAIALVCATTAGEPGTDNVAAALWRSVAHGGDSDSTGSLAGNILGAMYGDDVLPGAWREQLELRDLIERLAADLWKACIEGAEVDSDAYPMG